MIVLMFQSRFAALVAAGTKRQTVRPVRKRGPTRIGEVVSLRRWADKPYRSKQVVIATGRLLANPFVELDDLIAVVGGEEVDRHAFARADGFDSWPDLVAWFANAHGLPFRGVCYRWEPL
jgi:hypothetical protein